METGVLQKQWQKCRYVRIWVEETETLKRDIIKSFRENTWVNQDLKNFTWVQCFDSDGKYRALGETGWRHFSTWMFRSMGGWRVCGVTRWSRSIYWNTHKVFCAPSLSDKWSPSYLLLLKTHTQVHGSNVIQVVLAEPGWSSTAHLVSFEPVHSPRVFLSYLLLHSSAKLWLRFLFFIFLPYLLIYCVSLICVFSFYESTTWTFTGDKYLEISKGGLQGMSNAAIYCPSLGF